MTFTCAVCDVLANEEFPAPPEGVVAVFICWRCRAGVELPGMWEGSDLIGGETDV